SSPMLRSATSRVMQTSKPEVLLVDDDDDLRMVMQDLMAYMGVRSCVSAASLEGVKRQESAVLRCNLAILDINLGEGQPTGVQVHDWLKQKGFAGRIVFFTGHAADDPRVVEATRMGSQVLSKPLEIAKLARLLESVGGTS